MNIEHSPNRIAWPPIILVSTLVIGLALHLFVPITLSNALSGSPTLQGAMMAVGVVLVLAALGIDLACFRAMRRHHTTIMPNKGADHLLTTGIYSRSRNPIYVGNLMIVVGFGLAFNTVWLLVLTPLMANLLFHLAIEREEAHLAAKFGPKWEEYRKNTRRWV